TAGAYEDRPSPTGTPAAASGRCRPATRPRSWASPPRRPPPVRDEHTEPAADRGDGETQKADEDVVPCGARCSIKAVRRSENLRPQEAEDLPHRRDGHRLDAEGEASLRRQPEDQVSPPEQGEPEPPGRRGSAGVPGLEGGDQEGGDRQVEGDIRPGFRGVCPRGEDHRGEGEAAMTLKVVRRSLMHHLPAYHEPRYGRRRAVRSGHRGTRAAGSSPRGRVAG